MADIKPTMDDDGVMDFVANGYYVLEGVVDDAFNRRCRGTKPGPAKELVGSPDFIREVLLHPKVAGVVRSLLARIFLCPPEDITTSSKNPLWDKTGIQTASPAPVLR